MYNLLVKYGGWGEVNDSIGLGRVLEYTSDAVCYDLQPDGQLDVPGLQRLPTLLMPEVGSDAEQLARIVRITAATKSRTEIAIEYAPDPIAPAIPISILQEHANAFHIADFEFSRSHWAVKDVDLFRALLRHQQPTRRRPTAFQLAEHESIERQLISAMMPFHPAFDAVYGKLCEVAAEFGLRCRRADDIWENPAVMQDVVNLIDKSNLVIADCTGRNPNVFYEIGIAHTLGRDVILLTQSEQDIPFDLRHLRYVKYLPNGEGLDAMADRLRPRLADVDWG